MLPNLQTIIDLGIGAVGLLLIYYLARQGIGTLKILVQQVNDVLTNHLHDAQQERKQMRHQHSQDIRNLENSNTKNLDKLKNSLEKGFEKLHEDFKDMAGSGD